MRMKNGSDEGVVGDLEKSKFHGVEDRKYWLKFVNYMKNKDNNAFWRGVATQQPDCFSPCTCRVPMKQRTLSQAVHSFS